MNFPSLPCLKWYTFPSTQVYFSGLTPVAGGGEQSALPVAVWTKRFETAPPNRTDLISVSPAHQSHLGIGLFFVDVLQRPVEIGLLLIAAGLFHAAT